MKIAIHQKASDFSSKWIEYCQLNEIPFKIVNAYENDIINQVSDCDAFMWHFSHSHPKDVLFAKQLLFSLQTIGMKVFPDFHSAWHFDDKIGQKYLLESINAPLVPSYVFYDQNEALDWIEETDFPKVFKLRGGAGSAHVKLVKDRTAARILVRKAFGKGFSQYDKIANLKDRWYKYKIGETGLWDLIKGLLRFVKTTEFAKIAGNEIGYAYFQEFIPNNDHDIRVVIIGDKAFAIKRMVRENDFRASGSGIKYTDKEIFQLDTIKLAFEVTEKLKSQCVAFDFIYKEGMPKIVEISYGFTTREVSGYWDRKLNWHNDSTSPQEWMVEALLKC